MCSITGFLTHTTLFGATLHAMAELLKLSEERGRDGFGYTAFWRHHTHIEQRRFVPPRMSLVDDDMYKVCVSRSMGAAAFIANHRAEPTTEFVKDKRESDQQPYVSGDWWAVHNGTIANDKSIIANYATEQIPTLVDSYAIPIWLAAGHHPIHMLKELKGSIAALLWNDTTKEFFALRNFNPMTILYLPAEKTYIFSSLPRVIDLFPDAKVIPFPPYSIARNFRPNGRVDITTSHPDNKKKALVVCSGGLDSVTAAAIAKMECDNVSLLHFKYGCQAEEREAEAVVNVAGVLGCDVRFVDMGWLKQLGGSTLTTGGPIAGGVAGAELDTEWVPARNTAMIGIAAAYADRLNCGKIYLGLNLEESGAYCDNTVEFFKEFNHVLDVGTHSRAEIVNPLATLTKKEIVRLAYEICAPINLAWSCYRGGAVHCGQCGPCHMRRVAHEMLEMTDTVQYANPRR